ncbi:MAG: aldo/keto reductase [Chromatiales bacterium]
MTAGDVQTSPRIVLGLGLIAIGRTWGYKNPEIPSSEVAEELLRASLALGVTYLDTAPSYGVSELRLGQFLSKLRCAERNGLTVATKFGEHWDEDRGVPYVDHSYDALARSLEQSLSRLGRIDALQLHKASLEVLQSRNFNRAIRLATSLGIAALGASTGKVNVAYIALRHERLAFIQVPFNWQYPAMQKVLTLAATLGKTIVVNRPFGEGRLLYDDAGAPFGESAIEKALEFVLHRLAHGVVLVGTRSVNHLRQTFDVFQRILEGRDSLWA